MEQYVDLTEEQYDDPAVRNQKLATKLSGDSRKIKNLELGTDSDDDGNIVWWGWWAKIEG